MKVAYTSFVVSITCCAVGFLVMLFCLSALFSIKRVVTWYDPLFSVKHCQEIGNVISDSLPKRFSAYHVDELPKLIPSVSHASARFSAHGTACYRVHAWRPIWNINNTHALLENNALIELDALSEDSTRDLPKLYLKHALEDCAAMVRAIPYELIEWYDVTIQDHEHVYCHDRQDSYFWVLTTIDKIASLDRDVIARLKMDISKQKVAKNRTTNWIADLRYDHQIIVRSQKGGAL